MKIIVNGLTEDVSASDLYTLITSNVKVWWYYPTYIYDIEVLLDKRTGKTFAFITLVSENSKLEKKVIDFLNSVKMGSSKLSARKTQWRNLSNCFHPVSNERRHLQYEYRSNNMKIFINNIGHRTTKRDIHALIMDNVRIGLLRRKPNIHDIELLKITDMDTAEVEYHAIVTVKDMSVADIILHKISKLKLRSRPVSAHYYVNRLLADQRFDGDMSDLENKRRSNLKIEHLQDDELIVRAYENFHRIGA